VKDRDQNYSTRRLPIDLELPLVVLVNKNSASASEIVSGSIQDMDRGVVMGQRTYGKGLVQNHKEVGYNSRIKITTSKYYIPSGRCIQSVAYENGEPKNIADADREVFYTRNKRPVLDGGGVTPDVKIEAEEDPEILKALKNEHWIFKFANEYVHQHPAIDSFEAFQFNDYEAFTNYLVNNNFSFTTSKEKALKELITDKSDSPYASPVKEIESLILAEKSDDLIEYQDRIKDEIEAELSKRYFLQEGKTRQMLKNDPEVEEAIKLLKDQSKYAMLLSKA
jgi:carboxyl-terminal processing protease